MKASHESLYTCGIKFKEQEAEGVWSEDYRLLAYFFLYGFFTP